jgi:signal transduction histidine kinase
MRCDAHGLRRGRAGMIARAFHYRSGRVIAFGRAVLAVFFLIVIWLDRSQPVEAPAETYALLGAYAVAAIAYLFLTWDDWWLESRLGGPAHFVDLATFILLNFATRGYASPFFTFFIFLVLSASIRWGWRQTALTAAAIILLYLVEGFTASSGGPGDFHLRRFMIRGSYLLVLSSMVILWFASNQRSARPAPPLPARLGGHVSGMEGEDIRILLAYAAARFASGEAILLWSEADEPWTYLARLRGGEVERRRFAPGRFDPPVNPEVGEGPFIFDQDRARVLRRSVRQRVAVKVEAPVNPALAAELGLASGLRIPIRSNRIEGEMFVTGMTGLCADDLAAADEAVEQVSAALEHAELFQATEDAAAMRARLALARDIHDGVMQFLAGLTLRMEGVRKAAHAGREVDADIDDLQRELIGEQQDLRRYLRELRRGGGARASAELTASVDLLVRRMACQWGIVCTMRSEAERIDVPAPLELEVHQLVREAVANAVRHGQAHNVETLLARRNGSLALSIGDDGAGFPIHGEYDETQMGKLGIGPRSLHERVQNLGGSLRLTSCPKGSRLDITLPLQDA